MLDILEEYCQLRQYTVARIDGHTKGNERQEAIDAFSCSNSPYFIFLLSTRAGGLGINLTAADTVIIYDSDWNPQNDSQATARCHRIGQKQEVSVYRLLTRHTYEYEMFERASRKLAIETVVLNHEKMLKNSTGENNETPVGENNETPVGENNETPVGENNETPVGDNNETPTLPEESSIAECQLNDALPEDQESTSTKQVSGNQLEDMPDGEWVMSEEKNNSDDDDEYVMEEDEEDSVITKNTEGHSVSTERTERTLDYGIPACPVIPRKRRGRKSTKKRTIEDELNPLKRSKNEVEEMLRRGLFDCLMSNTNENGIDFFEADIDTILKKNLKPVNVV